MKESAPVDTEELTLEALVQLHDEAFVNSAYEAILGRPSDPGGRKNYLAQVRAGVHKAHIVAELAVSPEGKLKSSNLPGLRRAIALYKKRTPSFWNRLVRRLARASLEDIERQLRVIDNRLYLTEQGLQRQSRLLTDLITLVRETTLPAANPRAPSHSSKGDIEIHAPPLSHLSPIVGRAFVELKAAIAAKQSN